MSRLSLTLLVLTAAIAECRYVAYHFRYSGRVSLSMQELKSQAAAASVQGELVVQPQENRLFLQLKNIEVNEYNGPFGCKPVNSRVPAEASPIVGDGKQLEEPFFLYLDQGIDLHVPSADLPWMINFRRALVSNLMTDPLIQVFMKTQTNGTSFLRPFYSVYESSIFGMCNTRYSLRRVTEPEATVLEEELRRERRPAEEEEEAGEYGLPKSPFGSKRTPTGVHKAKKAPSKHKVADHLRQEAEDLKDRTLWKMVRSPDFDDCRVLSFLQSSSSSLPHDCVPAGNQCKNLYSRSSRGEYILRGGPEGLRLERGTVEGILGIMPLGYKTEMAHSMTTVDIFLTAVKSSSSPLNILGETKGVGVLYYQFVTPFMASESEASHIIASSPFGYRHPLHVEEVIAGIRIPQNERQKEIDSAVDSIVKAVQSFVLEKASPALSEDFLTNTAVFKSLSEQELLMILNTLRSQLVQDSYESMLAEGLFYDTAASSGTREAVRFLLTAMKSGSLGKFRSISVLLLLARNVFDPFVVQEMLDYAIDVSFKESPALATAAHVSFSSLARRLCLENDRPESRFPRWLFPKDACPHSVLKKYIEHVKENIWETEQDWQRNVYLLALASLGTADAVPLLKEAALGTASANLANRAYGIYAFFEKVGRTKANDVGFELLMCIMENTAEDAFLRQLAFSGLVSMTPDASWWHRVALMTWHDPSPHMRSYVASLIEELSEINLPHLATLRLHARHVLPLVRPPSHSMKYSGSSFHGTFGSLESFGSIAFAWFKRSKQFFPADLYLMLNEDLGGLPFMHLEVFSLINNVDFRFPFRGRTDTSSLSGNQVAEDILKDMKEELEMDDNRKGRSEVNIHIKLLENIVYLFPKEFVNFELLHAVLSGHPIFLAKYANPVDVVTSVPTELGLSLTYTGQMPVVAYLRNYFKPDEKGSTNLHVYTSIDGRITSGIRVLLPWSGHALFTGVRNRRSLSLPVSFALEKMEEEGKPSGVGVRISLATDAQHNLFSASNEPVTSITSIIKSDKSKQNVLILDQGKRGHDRMLNPVKWLTGMDISISWKGDSPYPLTFEGILKEVKRQNEDFIPMFISKSAALWRLVVVYNPTTSDCTQLAIRIPSYEAEEGESAQQGPKIGQFAQESAESFEQFSQDSSFEQIGGLELESFGQKGQSFGGVEQEPSDPESDQFLHGDTHKERLRKFSIIKQKMAGEMSSAGVIFVFTGKKERKYEILVSSATERRTSTKTLLRDARIALLAPAVEGVSQEPFSLCVAIKSSAPTFTEFDTLQSVSERNLNYSSKAEFYTSSSCSAEPLLVSELRLSMTKENWKLLMKDIQKSCSLDPLDPMVEFHNLVKYDLLENQATVSKTQDYMQSPYCALFEEENNFILGHVLRPWKFSSCNIKEWVPPGKFTWTSHRDLLTNEWAGHIGVTGTEISYTGFVFPPYLDLFFSVGTLAAPSIHWKHLIINGGESNKCVLNSTHVKTFDGFVYERDDSECGQVVALSTSTDSEFAVVLRSSPSGHGGVAVTHVPHSLHVEITREGILVNDEVVDFFSNRENLKCGGGRLCGVALNVENHYGVVIFGELAVFVKGNDMEVKMMNPGFYGRTKGLCGDGDGDPNYELVGPKSCLYLGGDAFADAWTVPGGSCSRFEFMRKKKDVRRYQSGCPRPAASLTKEQAAELYGML